MKKKFKFLEHTADIKFQSFGGNLEEAFENSALALFNIMYDGEIKKIKMMNVRIKGKDFESLLYNFLEELLFLFENKYFFLSKIKNLKIDPQKFILTAELLGDNSSNYEAHLGVKAITYNDMFVRKEKNKYVCQVVVDV